MYLEHKNMKNKIEYRSSHIYTTVSESRFHDFGKCDRTEQDRPDV